VDQLQVGREAFFSRLKGSVEDVSSQD